MKRKNPLVSLLSLCVAVACLLPCFIISANASVTTTSGTTTIQPTDEQFEAAEDEAEYSATSLSFNISISQSYQMYIYHYEAPASGYYAIYTTGSLDTVGAIFEEQNTLWITDYELVEQNDDGCKIDNIRNCSMVVYLDKNENYYICVLFRRKKLP